MNGSPSRIVAASAAFILGVSLCFPRVLTAGTAAADDSGGADAAVNVLRIEDRYEIVFDTSQAPQLDEWVEQKLKPAGAAWYPRIVAMLPSEGYEAPRRFSITFHAGMEGVAHAAGTRISCAVPWFERNLEGEAVGAVVHEMVHVVQQYPHRPGAEKPGWLVEGVADYIRWFLFEPDSQRPRPNPQRANHDDSYRTTGHFLDYVTRTHDERIVAALNAALRQGAYTEALWKERTGRTLADLSRAWKRTLQPAAEE